MAPEQMDIQEGPPRDPARAVLGTVLGTIRLALADRALVWVALLAGIAFTAWALARPDLPRLVGVAGFAVVIFWPILWSAHRRK